MPASLETARGLWSDQEAWDERIADFAVARLVELFETEWREEAMKKRKKAVDAAQLREKLKLETVRVEADGKFTFFFASTRLYLDHGIGVSGDLAKGPTGTQID